MLAALATRRMLLGEPDAARPLAERAVSVSVSVSQRTGADAVHAHGLCTLGIVKAQHGELKAVLADLQQSFTLARRAGSVLDMVRAAAKRVYLLYRAVSGRGGHRRVRGAQRGGRHRRAAGDDVRDRLQRRGALVASGR